MIYILCLYFTFVEQRTLRNYLQYHTLCMVMARYLTTVVRIVHGMKFMLQSSGLWQDILDLAPLSDEPSERLKIRKITLPSCCLHFT
jgi:hypothetical protein